MDSKQRIAVTGVRTIPGESVGYSIKCISNFLCEVKLKFPESKVTKRLNSDRIHTILKLSELDFSRIETTLALTMGNDYERMNLLYTPANCREQDTVLRELVSYLFDSHDIQMDMEVAYSHYGNLEAYNVVFTSIRKRD